jgi:hypothetical protein
MTRPHRLLAAWNAFDENHDGSQSERDDAGGGGGVNTLEFVGGDKYARFGPKRT